MRLKFTSLLLLAGLAFVRCGVPPASSSELQDDTLAMTSALTTGTCSTAWQELSATQRASILAGDQVVIEGSVPAVWEATAYEWIHPGQPRTGPEGAAAVYWDLPGQVSYLAPLGLVGLDVIYGEDTAAVAIVGHQAVPTPAGPVVFDVPQVNSVLKSGPQCYRSVSHTSSTSQPLPGYLSVIVNVRFESFPGDQGGTLLAYNVSGVPSPAIASDATARAQALAFLAAVASAHVTRMEQGATPAQVRTLRRALR